MSDAAWVRHRYNSSIRLAVDKPGLECAPLLGAPRHIMFAKLMSHSFAQRGHPISVRGNEKWSRRRKPARRQHGKAASRRVDRLRAATGYIYILVAFGRWQRDQITDTICLTAIGDSSHALLCPLPRSPLFQPQNIRQSRRRNRPFMPFIAPRPPFM